MKRSKEEMKKEEDEEEDKEMALASGDGVLQLEEVRRGFKQILGSDCPGSAEVDDLFHAVDLEGSGSIDFTEFVAAGLGQRASQQDDD